MDEGLAVRLGVTTRQATSIAWDRALAFSWTGHRVQVLAKFMAVLLWPFQLATVGGQGSRIRRIEGASLAVNDGKRQRVHWPTVVVAVTAIVAELALILSAGSGLALVLLPLLPPTLAAVLGLLVVVAPLLVEVIGGMTTVLSDTESLMLNRRRDELSQLGPAATMSALVRSSRAPAGAGRRLLAVLIPEWQQQQLVVVFLPATAPLVSYYAQQGAVLDDGARRRMKFDCRRGSSQTITSGDGHNH